MMASNRAGPGSRLWPRNGAGGGGAILQGIASDAPQMFRGGETRAQMIALDRTDPVAIDDRCLALTPALEAAVRDHSAL